MASLRIPEEATAPPAAPASAPAPAADDWYTRLLKNDPTLQALLLQISNNGVANQANLTGAQQQAMARLGELVDPSLLPPQLAAHLGNLGAALTPELSGLVNAANESGVSALAQLAHNYQQAQSRSVGSLGERGIIRSGAYGQHAAENLHDYTLGQYQARQGALDSLAGLQGTFAQQQQDLAGQAGTATNDALGRLTAQIQAGLVAPPGAAGAAPPPSAAPAGAPTTASGGYAAQPGYVYSGSPASTARRTRTAAPTWGSQRTTRAL